MYYVLDRFEGIFAVCEDENYNMINIERSIIPKEAKEGDVLIMKDQTVTIDIKLTEERRKRVETALLELWD